MSRGIEGVGLVCVLLLGNVEDAEAQDGRLHLQPGQRVEEVDLFSNQDPIANPLVTPSSAPRC
jgi:hypothetical protein